MESAMPDKLKFGARTIAACSSKRYDNIKDIAIFIRIGISMFA